MQTLPEKKENISPYKIWKRYLYVKRLQKRRIIINQMFYNLKDYISLIVHGYWTIVFC